MARIADWILYAVVLIGTMIYLMRTALILAGWHKGPILRLFEQYGDDEPFYYPFPGLLVALAVFALFGGGLLAPMTRAWCLPFGPAVGLGIAAYYAHSFADRARDRPEIFMRYPLWVHALVEDTSREERRRIAYRWRSLPRRTRLLLSSSDRAFFQWADLVVMSTLY